jgi:hypothetical protein
MNRWLWELRRMQWRLGTFGLLALLVAGSAAVIFVVQILPLRTDIDTRDADLSARAARLKQPPPPSPDEAVAPVSADERYLVFLHGLHSIAAKSGLQIPQITYQLPAQDDKSALRRYVVDAAFTSTYLQLRNFVHGLRTLPGTRCERLTVSRPNIGETQLDVHLQCSFLVEAMP